MSRRGKTGRYQGCHVIVQRKGTKFLVLVAGTPRALRNVQLILGKKKRRFAKHIIFVPSRRCEPSRRDVEVRRGRISKDGDPAPLDASTEDILVGFPVSVAPSDTIAVMIDIGVPGVGNGATRIGSRIPWLTVLASPMIAPECAVLEVRKAVTVEIGERKMPICKSIYDAPDVRSVAPVGATQAAASDIKTRR